MKATDHPTDPVELRSPAEAAFRKKAAASPGSLEAPTPEAARRLLHERLEKEERLSLATLQSGVGIWDWNLITQKLIWDDSMFSLYQINREDFIGTEEAWRAALHPDDLERGDREASDAISGKKPYDTEFRIIWPNGEIRYIKAVAKVFRDEQGTPNRMLGTNWDITASKEAETALRAADQKLRLHFELSPLAVIEWDLDFRVTRWNPAAEAIFGYSREEAVGQHASFIIPEAFRSHVDQIWQALVKKSGGDRSSNENLRKDGMNILCEWYNTPLIDERGTFTGAASVVQDITERKQTEQALATTAELLERTGEMAKVGGWELDLVTLEHTWSLATCRILEVDPPVTPALEQGINFFAPEARPVIQAAVQAGTEHGTPYELELPVLTAKGRPIWVRAQGHAVMANGKAIKLVGALHDITERRQAEQLLAWEKDALELISSALSLPEVLDGLMLGLEKQLPGSLCSVLLLDNDGIRLRHGAAPSLPDAYNRAIDGAAIGPEAGSCGTAVYARRQVIVADIVADPLWDDYRELALGHGLHACWSTPIHGDAEKILGTFAIYYREPRHPVPAELGLVARAVHITRIAIQRKQAEEALRESEQEFRTLFENAGDAIFLMRGEEFADCNARALEMFGCHSRDEFVKHPPYEFSPPFQPNGRDSREFAIEKITAALDGRPQFFEWVHAKLDGTPFPTEVNLNMVEVSDKVLLQAVVRDISERKRAEDMIRRQNTELETRVEQRTADLSKANEKLRRHMVARRKLEQEVLKVSELEQKRIGQDLHDDLGQQLAGIWCLSQLLESSLASQKSPDATSAARITRQLKESLELTRTLAQGLHPVMPQADGLSSALDELARRTSDMFGVNCRCKCPQRLLMDNTIAMHFYRIAQESVTNAAKHGHAKNIEIELSANSRHAILSVSNDGMPMAKKTAPARGMGLRIMKYRADMIGGRLSIRTNKDSGGTIVTCTVPAPSSTRESNGKNHKEPDAKPAPQKSLHRR